jgi:hypothetical protein
MERRRQPRNVYYQIFSVISYLLDRILLEFSFFLLICIYIYVYMFSHAEGEEREVPMCIINVHLVVAEQKDA